MIFPKMRWRVREKGQAVSYVYAVFEIAIAKLCVTVTPHEVGLSVECLLETSHEFV